MNNSQQTKKKVNKVIKDAKALKDVERKPRRQRERRRDRSDDVRHSVMWNKPPTRNREKRKGGKGGGRRGGQKSVTGSGAIDPHSTTIAYCHSLTAMGSKAMPLPAELGVGESTAEARIFPFTTSFKVEANTDGFAFAIFEASGWIPSDDTTTSQPVFSSIGAPGLAPTAEAPNINGRGVIGCYSNKDYVGLSSVSTSRQVPRIDSDLLDGSFLPVIPGVTPLSLPENFFNGQTPTDSASDFEGENLRESFTLNAIKATIQPSGYETGAAGAVNVVSGDVMAWTYLLGDNRSANVTVNTLGDGVPIPSMEFIEQQVNKTALWSKQAAAEWPKGEKMHVHAVPNTSCCKGQWPPWAVVEVPSFGEQLEVLARVNSPQCGFLIDGAQPGQVFDVKLEMNFTMYGAQSWEQKEGTRSKAPVNPMLLNDVLARTLPAVSKPVVLKPGKQNPAAVKAYAKTLSDTGTPKSAISSIFEKAAGPATEMAGEGVGDVIGEVLGGIAAFLF